MKTTTDVTKILGTGLVFISKHVMTIVVALLVVSYWRGTWVYLDQVLFPESQALSSMTCLIASAVLYVLIHLLSTLAVTSQRHLPKTMKWTICFSIFHYLIVWLSGLCAVVFWRGIWYSWDLCVDSNDLLTSGYIGHLVGVFGLIVLLHLRSIVAPPLAINEDNYQNLSFPLFQWNYTCPCCKCRTEKREDTSCNSVEKDTEHG